MCTTWFELPCRLEFWWCFAVGVTLGFYTLGVLLGLVVVTGVVRFDLQRMESCLQVVDGV